MPLALRKTLHSTKIFPSFILVNLKINYICMLKTNTHEKIRNMAVSRPISYSLAGNPY